MNWGLKNLNNTTRFKTARILSSIEASSSRHLKYTPFKAQYQKDGNALRQFNQLQVWYQGRKHDRGSNSRYYTRNDGTSSWLLPLALLASPVLLTEATKNAHSKQIEHDSNQIEQLTEDNVDFQKNKKLFNLKELACFISFCIDKYILLPTKVLLRLIYLSFNFLPVLIYFPTCFVGDEKTKNRRFNSFYNYLTYRIELAGPTFVKLGQWAATRADLFPKEFCEVLSKLHSRVNPHPISYTRKLFQECFPGLTLEDVFDEFLEKPIGVGAMAQVYRAKLKKDLVYQDLPNINDQLLAPACQLPPLHNGYVAVKVLHPRARKSVERDLIILSILASVVTTLVPTLQWVSLQEEVKTFSKMMHEQLDLITEANNLTKLRHNFRTQKEVKFPRPILPLVSESILVEKFEHGVPLKKFMDLGEDGVFNQDIAAVGLNSFLKMLLLDNFIHADLHPGNIMVKFYRPSKDGWFNKLRSILDYTFRHQSIEDIFNKIRAEYPGDFEVSLSKEGVPSDGEGEADIESNLISNYLTSLTKDQFKEVLNDLYTISFYPQFIFLDAGLVTTLDDINRINFIDLFKSVAEFDGKKSGELIIDRSSRPEQVTNREEFVAKMSSLILHLRSSAFKLSSVDISSLLGNVFSMVRNHRVKLEGEFVNVVMSIMILEGVGRTLDPELDLFREALPLLRSLGTSSITPASTNPPMHMSDGPFWFIKIWFGLEARQILFNTTSPVSELRHMFGEFTEPVLMTI